MWLGYEEAIMFCTLDFYYSISLLYMLLYHISKFEMIPTNIY